MLNTIYLHIGFEKTGTTSLQEYLTSNRKSLLKNNVLIPESGCKSNHWALLPFALDSHKNDILKFSKELYTPTQTNEFKINFAKQLSTELKSTKSKYAILSLEHLSSRSLELHEIKRLKNLLSAFTNNIIIIGYIRPQWEYILSIYSTRVKSGLETEKFKIPSQNDKNFNRYNYLHLLYPWIDTFGLNAIKIRIYQNGHLYNNDIIDDFFYAIQLQDCANFIRPMRLNKRLGPITIELLRKLNPYLGPYATEHGPNKSRLPLIRALPAVIEKNALTLSNETKRKIMDAYKESNKSLQEKFFSDHDGQLFHLDCANNDIDFFKIDIKNEDIFHKLAEIFSIISQ